MFRSKNPTNWRDFVVEQQCADGSFEVDSGVQNFLNRHFLQILMTKLKVCLFLTNLRPWDLRGSILFFNILRVQHRFCGEFVQSQMFKSYLRGKQADIVVIDHFIQVSIG